MAIYLETLTNAGKKQINCNQAQSGELSRAGLARFRTNASNVSFGNILPTFTLEPNSPQNISITEELSSCFPHCVLPWKEPPLAHNE